MKITQNYLGVVFLIIIKVSAKRKKKVRSLWAQETELLGGCRAGVSRRGLHWPPLEGTGRPGAESCLEFLIQ